MNRWLGASIASGFWLAIFYIAAACGGGTSPSIPAAAPAPTPATIPAPVVSSYDWRDYSGLRASYKASGWRSEQTGPDTFVIYWGDSGEEQRIAPNPADGGKLWVWLDAYTAPGGIRFVSVTDRAEVDRMDGKGWISVQPTGIASSPYLPVEIGANGVRVRTWGWIYINGLPMKRWFWHTTIKAPTPEGVYNSCWLLDNATRKAFYIQEAWWDTGGDNWSDRGRGDIDPATREPSGEGITYDYWIYNAEMINGHGGYAWRYGYTSGGFPGCAQF